MRLENAVVRRVCVNGVEAWACGGGVDWCEWVEKVLPRGWCVVGLGVKLAGNVGRLAGW